VRVYLAAQFARRKELREYREILHSNGITVTSRWLDDTSWLSHKLSDFTDEDNKKRACDDIDDISHSDVIIFFSENPTVGVVRGGRHVEFGYAWATGKDIYVLGPKENIFHTLDNVFHYDTMKEVIDVLKTKRYNGFSK
jgi:hypothetical protein